MKRILIIFAIVVSFITHVFGANGEELYKKCVACHGLKAEKVFNNKVPALTTFNKEQIIESMKGYKDKLNKYKMGMLMKPVSKPLSDEDIEALADFIQSLK
ncbi:MAG: c-type cytochrome [Campylobacter sp.]|nr:c-type cytochrome [Campylobacter sp.]